MENNLFAKKRCISIKFPSIKWHKRRLLATCSLSKIFAPSSGIFLATTQNLWQFCYMIRGVLLVC